MKNELTVNAEGGAVEANRATTQRWLRPRYDHRRLDDGDYQLRVWMPGVDKKAVSIALERDTLTIQGVRVPRYGEGWEPVLQELPEGDYRLSLTLNMRVDEDKIGAHIEDGVLVLDLPIVEEAKPREIAIE